jgi:hypothetical protein
MDTISTTQTILRDAGFETRIISLQKFSALRFEDESILGFVIVFLDAQSLLSEWQQLETGLVRRYAESFRLAGDKAWNVYTVLICTSDASPEDLRRIRWIEENLERTRKLTACNVVAREDVTRALLPLLPLQYQPALEEQDLTKRLERRIYTIAPAAASVVLKEDVPPIEVVTLLGELK